MSEPRPRYSCVVPVYDEEGSLPLIEAELLPALRGLDGNFELLIVDDGSTDGTPAILEAMLDSVPELVVWRHDANRGLSAALDTGFTRAVGEIVITLDGDLQNDPADIPRLLAGLETADVVIGWRRVRDDPWLKRVSSRIANGWRNWRTGDDVHDSSCPLKVFRREAYDRIRMYDGLHRFLPTLFEMEGFTVAEVEVSHRRRRAGTSKYGIANRLFKGLSDLRAVRWMKRNRLVARATRVRR
ncbi:MAG: glycosyltransferase family 2 protein [Planctomycetota bacterium]